MNLEKLEKKVAPAHTALLIIDMQRDYCCKGGIFDKMGFNLDVPQELATRLNEFLNQARKALKQIVHVKMTLVPELASRAMREHYERVGMMREFQPSLSEFYEIIPLEGETIIPKYRYSGFVSTYLDKFLRANQIKTLVVVGVATNVCVESTVRDGFMLDYSIVVPRDMTEGTDREAKEASLKNIETFFGEVVDSEDLLTCWELKAS
ncbi:MAG: cysteine hydrolase [Proteobacteria bacterium]|nr:cysteine hydrolase [Pseudomonadota bacterium]